MTAYKLKRFPPPFDAPWLQGVTQSCAFILLVNWCLQGMRGMDRQELGFRLRLELLVAGLVLAALPTFHAAPAASLALALFLAHSFSFTLNGQVWVCARYCRGYRRDPAAVERFRQQVCAQLRGLPWLEEAALIGSRAGPAARQGERSDIDLRLIMAPGPTGWLRTNLLLLRLRTLAFLRMIPLDLYAYDGPASLARFDQDEPLLLVLDRGGRLAAAFPGRVAR